MRCASGESRLAARRPRQPDARAIDGFREELVDWAGFQLDINYGYSKLRFPAPVPVGSKLRATLEVLGIEAVAARDRRVGSTSSN